MTAEEISSKVRQILQDYRRRNDYTLEDAQRDMANLMGVHAAQQPKMPVCCPVCGGDGKVPSGFYNTLTGIGPTISTILETCRTCNGSGVFVQQSKMPTEEEIIAEADARFTDRITGFVHSDKRDGFIRCGRWILKLSGFATK